MVNFTIQWKCQYKLAAAEVILLKHYCITNYTTAYKETFFQYQNSFRHEHWIIPSSAAIPPSLTKQKRRGTKLITPADQAFKAGNWFCPSCALNYILLRIFL